MKILLSHNLEGIGGGARFSNNFQRGCKKYFPDVEITTDRKSDYDVLFILTPTSIDNFDFIDEAKKNGKRIILRCDNLPKNSRNKRYRVWQKMVRLANLADEVIYQSQWAKDYIAWGEMPSKGVVIHNGVDTDIFNDRGARRTFREEGMSDIYLILISSSDPCKRLHEALDIFSQRHREYLEGKKKEAKLIIAGRLPDEYHVRLQEAGWDFVRGEKAEYIGEVNTPQEVAAIMRGCTHLVFPSYNDASPNTVLEAKACGLDIIASSTGGTPEILARPFHLIGLQVMISKYLEVFAGKSNWS